MPGKEIVGKGVTKDRGQNETRRSAGRAGRAFPGATFESVLPLAKAIWDHAGASREIRRETLFTDILKKAQESGPSRTLIRNSGRYGLTIGNEKSETIKLTEKAAKVLDPETLVSMRSRATLDLAIHSIPAFALLYERFKGGNLPAPAVMMDALTPVPTAERQMCVDVFIGNAKYAGVLVVRSGAEYLANVAELGLLVDTAAAEGTNASRPAAGGAAVDFSQICFVIAPIGEDGSPDRKHSDMVLALIERALESLKLQVVRADKITSPGMISRQIVEYVHKSRLVVADLSFGSENGFYELAVRHLIGLPIVHVIRRRDKLPFDVQNFRTVIIDDSDMYDLIAKLDSYRADIANHAREALDAGESTDNPILTFFPSLRVSGSH